MFARSTKICDTILAVLAKSIINSGTYEPRLAANAERMYISKTSLVQLKLCPIFEALKTANFKVTLGIILVSKVLK